jgi:hypothetical protein
LDSIEREYFSEYLNMKHFEEERFNIVEYVQKEDFLLTFKTIIDKTNQLCEFANNKTLIKLPNGLLGKVKEDPTM